MAKNREPVKAVSRSSDEETDSSSSDEQVAQPTITATSSKTPLPESSAESGEESSESEQPTITATSSKKPIPESDESGEEESESESEEEEETTVVKPKLTPAKRSLPVPQEKEILKTPDTKKAKKNEPIEKVKNSAAAAVSESSKKNLFQRIWSEEDEIVILKGLLEYPGEVNNANVDAFLDSIKEGLHSSEVNKVQLHDKIRRLKKKFKNNKAKKVRNFTKPIEKESYDLSLKIWGDSDSDTVVAAANGNAKSVKGKGKGKSVKANGGADSEAGAVEVASGYGEGKAKIAAGFKFGAFGSNVEKLLSIGADMFEGEEGVKGSKEWKKLEREEMELVHKHTKVILAKTNLVLDNMK